MSAENIHKSRKKRHDKTLTVRPQNASNLGRKIKRLVCFVEVRDRILEGRPLGEVAYFIQHDRRELMHLKRDTVIHLLSLYKRSIPPAEVLAHTQPKIVLDARDKLAAGLDELQEMEGLFRLQRERIELAHTNEKVDKKLDPELKHELRLAGSFLESRITIKEQLGLIEGKKKGPDSQVNVQLNQVNANVGQVAAQYGDKAESVKAVLEDPEKRRNVAGLLKSILSASLEKPTEGVLDALAKKEAGES